MPKSTICVFHAKMKTQRKPEQDFLSLKPNIVISRVVFFAIDVLFVKALANRLKKQMPKHVLSNDGPLLITARCASHIPATQEGSTGDGAPHNSNETPDRLGRYRS